MTDSLIEQARKGDAAAFRALCEPLRPKLVLHCYRMLGSLSEAEDATQQALLRAWSGLAGFEGRSTFQSWLYHIATRVSLTALEGKEPRRLRHADQPTDPHAPLPEPLDESHWIEPAPDAMFESQDDPESRYSRLESVSLAFLAALQLLPAKQRAVLILRDVIGWQAGEVAELLELGVPAVNSALQRARDTLEREYAAPARKLRRPTDEERTSLLKRYIEAWTKGDVAGLVALLKLDAEVTMPPWPTLFIGAAVGPLLTSDIFSGNAAGRFRMEPTVANGQLAAAAWMRGPDGEYRPSGIHVLTLDGNQISALVVFLEGRHVKRFGRA